MPETEKHWWKQLFRPEVLAGHVVNSIVALGVGGIVAVVVAVSLVVWAAWRGSYLWTQRLIGASIAFAIVLVAIAGTLWIIRRRLIPVPAKPASPKGYLDHQDSRDKAQVLITQQLERLSEITREETKETVARTKNIERHGVSGSPKKQLADSVREARAYDKNTKKLAALLPALESAVTTYSESDLQYWTWHTGTFPAASTNALASALIGPITDQLRSVEEHLDALLSSKDAIAGRLGRSQAMNGAVERRLVVAEYQCQIVRSQIAPLQKVIEFLKPFAGTTQK